MRLILDPIEGRRLARPVIVSNVTKALTNCYYASSLSTAISNKYLRLCHATSTTPPVLSLITTRNVSAQNELFYAYGTAYAVRNI